MAEQNHELEESDIQITAYHNHRLSNHKDEVINLLNEEAPVNRSNNNSKQSRHKIKDPIIQEQ